jgi:hypothetical protein
MTVIDTAKSAVNAFKAQADKIQTERENTAAEIGKLKAEIKRLRDMPVSRADFSLILKDHIKAQSEQNASRLVSALEQIKPNSDGNGLEFDRYNRRPLESLESNIHSGWFFSGMKTDYDFLSYSQLENGVGGIRSLLCFLFPDIIHDRIMQTVEEEIGEKWGNDDLPSVSERREKIIDMQNEIKDLEGKLAELDAAIKEFGTQTA